MAIKQYPGAAEQLTLNANISNSVTTFVVTETPTSNWPTAGNQYVISIRKTDDTNEEKLLCNGTSRSASTFSSVTRGFDGTTAVSHTSGEIVRVVWDAASATDASRHIYTTTDDDHSQYLNTTRHDVTARHAFGAALGTPAAAADVTTSAGAGSSGVPARSDHFHKLGAGAINSSTMFGTGVVASAAIVDATITDTDVAAANKDGVAGTASMRTLGTGATQAASGTDSRLSDTRTPSAGSVTQATHATGYRATFSGTSAPSSPSAGDMWYDTTNKLVKFYNGSVWITITPVAAKVATGETRTTGTYAGLATALSVTVATGTAAIVTVTATGQVVETFAATHASFAVSGASSIAALDENGITFYSEAGFTDERKSAQAYITTLTAGSNTFTAQYRGTGGTSGYFESRMISVVALPT